MSLSDSTSPAGPRRLAALAALQVAGVFAGAQLGKIAPLVGWYRDEAGMSLVAIGFLTAILGFFVAIAALPTAFLIDRFGNFRSFVVSSAVLAVGGILLALADGSGLVLAARFIEALGYLVIVICTPALLANYSPDALKAPMLAIWGGFVPIGFAIADFSAAAMLPAYEPPLYLLAVAGAFTIFALLAMLLTAGLAPLDVPERSEGGQRLMASFSPAVL
ncbi:MAG: MFS transporter, partial [Rhizobiaceae bacterium]|nr:MFS transporter [Rhizobiaceae bacterium]